MTPRILDFFCKAGGMAMGLHRAGFEVVGIDIEEQPNYPFDFYLADVMAMQQDRFEGCWHEYGKRSMLPGQLGRCLGRFDAIHASPPCQAHSDLQKQSKLRYRDYIPALRELLERTGLPYVIENVEGAPLRDPVVLCGTMFPGLRVLRHRLFETNWPLTAPPHPPGRHPLVFTHDKRKAHHGKLDQDTAYVQVTGGGNCTIANARAAMGIDWMTKDELNEAIPPAYGEYVGRQLMAEIQRRKDDAPSEVAA